MEVCELTDFRDVRVCCKHEYVKSGERERVIKDVARAESPFSGRELVLP